jgi:predicted MFS family arabinose efflux permease
MTASPPDHTIAGMRERYGARYRWLLLLAVMVGTMASVMSSTVVNVAIPDLSAHFALGQERAQWVSSGFMSAMTVSMLCTPWLLARFGYRATYGGCMWLLLVGGVVGGLAPYFPLVLAARMAEGLAAGVVLAPALGPSIGGLLVDAFGWRSIFFMVVPFCVLSFWLARRYVPTNAPGQTGTDRDATLDWGGLVLAAACTLSLLNGLVDLSRDAYASGGLLLAAAGLVLVVFVVQQRRMLRRRRRRHDATPPLMNLGLFADRRFAMGSIVAFIYGTALFGSTYLLPVYMQMGLGMSASLVGAILLPAGLVLAVAITLVGRLVDRYATHRLVSTGLALLAVSFALMSSVDGHAHGTTIVLLAAWAILGRIGLGFVLPSLNVGAMRGLARADIPQGASVINFLRMLGGAAGVSLCGIVLEWRLAMRGEQRLAAFDDTFLFLAAVCALAMLAAWQLRDAPARRA